MHRFALANLLAWLLSAHVAYGELRLHLRGVRRTPSLPPAGVAPPAAADAGIAATFAKLDVNKDGKVDSNEFVAGAAAGVLPLAAAPAPAPLLAPAPAPAVISAVSPASASAAEEEVEIPPHLLVPPALPQNIPEPPPPPHAPPPEPAPPPIPPTEGQLVMAPPSEDSVEAAGNVTEMMANVPGLDLDGSSPVQAPNTPPPLPEPMAPPPLPRVAQPQSPPDPVPEELMKPSPVSFGLDMARALPAKMAPLGVVSVQPVKLTSDPYRVLLSLSSRKRAAVADRS